MPSGNPTETRTIVGHLGEPKPTKKDFALAEASVAAGEAGDLVKCDNPLDGLSRLKHKAFVERYAIHDNATRAAIEAGYSAKQAHAAGYKLLQKPEVREAIAWIRAHKTIENGASVEWVIRGLMSEADFFGEGASPAARIRARELIGKWLGMWKDEVEHTGKITIVPSLEDVLEAKRMMLAFRDSINNNTPSIIAVEDKKVVSPDVAS